MTIEQRFWAKVKKTSTCWLWTGGTSKKGYGRFNFHGKIVSAHVASWRIRKGPIPKGMSVLHKCDVKLCVRCLFLGTQANNLADMRRKGRDYIRRGQETGAAKLTESDVRTIRARHDAGQPVALIARDFPHVQYTTVFRVAARQQWKHIH
jgi:hypothetical protein